MYDSYGVVGLFFLTPQQVPTDISNDTNNWATASGDSFGWLVNLLNIRLGLPIIWFHDGDLSNDAESKSDAVL